MGILSTGMAWLAEVFAGESITVRYLRNGVAYSVLAFPSSQGRSAQSLGESQATINSMDRVYSIRVSAWVAAGIIGPPEQGDRIEEWATGAVRPVVFEALPTAGEPVWDYGEPEQVTYQIRAIRRADGSASC